ncbi:MAG: TrpR-related protein YerC/YecD [Clostridia bacterium]|nr:TrpR-related protein YerC/YecD [Clostridia bacterium]
MSSNNTDIKELYSLVLSLENITDCKDLFEDLCTNKELEQMAQRIKAAKLLLKGNTYNQVMEQCDISSATLSRVSRCVQYGNGYKKFIK